MQLAVEIRRPPPLPHLRFTFSSPTPTLLFFHSSRPALLLTIRARAAQEQRSNLDLPPQLSLPSPALDGERTLSYLLPPQIERLGAGSSPCFHAVLSGCYSIVLRPVIWVYGGAGAPRTVSWRSLKLFIASVGSPNLLPRWDIFTRLLPNGACGPASRVDDYLCDASCSAFIYRHRGTRQNQDIWYKIKHGGGACSGLSNMIVPHHYHTHSFSITFNFTHLAGLCRNCTCDDLKCHDC